MKTRFSLLWVFPVLISLLLHPSIAPGELRYPHIVATLKVPGFIKILESRASRPGLLFALVTFDGTPAPAEKYGLYVFDVQDPANPSQKGYLALQLSSDYMALTPDGRYALVDAAYPTDEGEKASLALVDLSEPESPRLVSRYGDRPFLFRLSRNGKVLVLARDKDIELFDVSRINAPRSANKITLSVPVTNKHWSWVSAIALSQDGSRLIARDIGGHLALLNIIDPTNPKIVYEREDGKNIWPNLFDDRGRVYAHDGDGRFHTVYQPEPTLTPLFSYEVSSGSFDPPFVSGDGRWMILPCLDKTIRLMDISDPKAPTEMAKYLVPDFPGAVAWPDVKGFLFAGLKGALVSIDPSGHGLDTHRLLSAHDESLAAYQKPADPKRPWQEFFRAKEAARLLESAGVQDALRARPEGMTNGKYAQVLNDYGFFLARSQRGAEAVPILRKAIKTDPRRAVAYLNLGDALFSGIGLASSFQQKIAMNRDIRDAYKSYMGLSKKKVRRVGDFLAFNLADHAPEGVCEAVGDYATRGRMRELFALGNQLNIDINNDGKIERVVMESQGTMRIMTVRFFDPKTGDEIRSPEQEESKTDLGWFPETTVIPYRDGYYLLQYRGSDYPGYMTRIRPDNGTDIACTFSAEVTEEIGPKSRDTELCRRLLGEERPPYLPFEETHNLKRDDRGSGGLPSEADPGSALTFDFDNDGEKETLVSVSYSSGAGRGCGYTYFDLLDRRKNRIVSGEKRDLLVALQELPLGEAVRHPVPWCGGNVTGWFIHRGNIYYETRFEGDRPRDEGEEFHKVKTIRSRRIEDVCEYTFRKSFRSE